MVVWQVNAYGKDNKVQIVSFKTIHDLWSIQRNLGFVVVFDFVVVLKFRMTFLCIIVENICWGWWI